MSALLEGRKFLVQVAVNHLNSQIEDLSSAKATEIGAIAEKLQEQIERIQTAILLLRYDAAREASASEAVKCPA